MCFGFGEIILIKLSFLILDDFIVDLKVTYGLGLSDFILFD